jgi:hypothetical protein
VCTSNVLGKGSLLDELAERQPSLSKGVLKTFLGGHLMKQNALGTHALINFSLFIKIINDATKP